jgi:hypothetical protein
MESGVGMGSPAIVYPEINGNISEDELRLSECRERARGSVADSHAQAERDRTWLLGLVDRLLRGEHVPTVAFSKMETLDPVLAARAKEG